MVLLVLAAALVVTLAAVLPLSRRWRESAPRMGRVQRLAAVAVAVGTSLALLPMLIADRTGTVGIALVAGPPVVLTLVAAAAPLLRHPGEAIVTWSMTALFFAYIIVYGLGVGLLYCPAGFLLFVVALTRTRTTHLPRLHEVG
ncbi:MAG TPA: hypothetical protein VF062_29065 [Candidatus Limnocylindrales bacterium]